MIDGSTPGIRIALSLTLPIILVAGFTFLRRAGEDVAPPLAIDDPRFLTWSGAPHDDGLNHFIVAVAAAEGGTQGRLHRDGDGQLSGIHDWLDDMLVTPEGLPIAPVPGNLAIASMPVAGWAGVLCDDPVCPGWVLET